MKKFEIRANTREVNGKEALNKDLIHAGCTLEQDFCDSVLEEEFDTKEEALEALKKYSSSVVYHASANSYYLVTEYYVEENEYDEDGDWVGGGDIWEYAKFCRNDFEGFNK